jgi:hypothetical protein
MPSALAWVSQIRALKNDINAYFLNTFLHQNVDLIIENADLRAVLAPALVGDGVGDDGTVTSATSGVLMFALQHMLRKPASGCAVGVIIDEAQVITQIQMSIQTRMLGGKDVSDNWEHQYQEWNEWSNTNAFVRMDIGSSHGVRELSLKSGTYHRLRFVQPWSAEIQRAALQHASSPLHINPNYKRTHDVLNIICGGIPRLLFECKEASTNLLADKQHKDKQDKDKQEKIKIKIKDQDQEMSRILFQDVRSKQQSTCEKWFFTLSEMQKVEAYRSLTQLVCGKLMWNSAKVLYDAGLVVLSDQYSKTVRPVSPLACSVIFRVVVSMASFTMASMADPQHQHQHHTLNRHRTLDSIANGAERGYELQRQTLNRLSFFHETLPVKLLNGSNEVAGIQLRTDVMNTFEGIAQNLKTQKFLEILYIPNSENYPCDAITIPAFDDTHSPIIVWEMSVTHPRESGRVQKILKWFDVGCENENENINTNVGQKINMNTEEAGGGGGGGGGTSTTGGGGTSTTVEKTKNVKTVTTTTKKRKAKAGIISQLHKLFPKRNILCVLVWNGYLVLDDQNVSQSSKYKSLDLAAANFASDRTTASKGLGKVSILVLDNDGLFKLGVL